MSTTKKVLIGLVTFLPLLIFAGFMVSIFIMAGYYENPTLDQSIVFLVGMGIVYLLMIVTGIINVIVYINHTVKNRRIEEGAKVLWLCLMFFFSFIVMMIYYFVYIVTEKPESVQLTHEPE